MPLALDWVTEHLEEVITVDSQDYDGTGEWFLLSNNDCEDDQLYWILTRNWAQIVGPYMQQFALVYCQGGPDSGTWLHYLSTQDLQNEYLPGKYWVDSWS